MAVESRRIVAVTGAGFNWVDVRDVVNSAMEAERRGRTGERYLLAGERLSLVDLARLWGKVPGVRPPRLTTPMWLARAGGRPVSRGCRV